MVGSLLHPLPKFFIAVIALSLTLGNILPVHAAIIFQDDSFATVESTAIIVGSNDVGSVDTSIQFGADSTGSENGLIKWNITGNFFSVDHSVVLLSSGLSTTGSGSITSDGLLTASNGFTQTTGALNLTATSGALNVSGLSASSISSGANNITFDSGNFDVTATGINNTVIGATTASSGIFTTLQANTSLTLPAGTGTLAPILKHLSVQTANVASSAIAASTCANYATITVTGAAVGDSVVATPTAVGGGIETVNLIWNATVSAANTVLIRACQVGGLLPIDTANTQTWDVDIWEH